MNVNTRQAMAIGGACVLVGAVLSWALFATRQTDGRVAHAVPTMVVVFWLQPGSQIDDVADDDEVVQAASRQKLRRGFSVP